MECWTSLRTTNRDIAASLGISATFHLAVLLVFGAAIYTSGEDDMDVPELSVQLETREGPSSEEFTEAALPRPMPDPVEDVLDDPGTGVQTLDAEALADVLPALQDTPDVAEMAPEEAFAEIPTPQPGSVITTTSESSETVAAITHPEAVPEVRVAEPEQVMLAADVVTLPKKRGSMPLEKARPISVLLWNRPSMTSSCSRMFGSQ